jgi:hypothetical protein
MLRTTLCLLLLLTCRLEVAAQDSLRHNKLVPRHALKFSPFHLINFYPTLEFSYEQRITRTFTAQVEYGYVLDYNQDDESYRDKRGYKMKLEVRKYFAPVIYRRLIFYGAAEYYWNNIDFDRRYSQQECFGTDCEHTIVRYQYYPVQYNEQGFSVKFGLMKYFFSHFFMDVNSGWTIRFVDYDVIRPNGITAFPEGEEDDLFFDIPNEEDRVVPCPVLGIRIGYRFR